MPCSTTLGASHIPCLVNLLPTRSCMHSFSVAPSFGRNSCHCSDQTSSIVWNDGFILLKVKVQRGSPSVWTSHLCGWAITAFRRSCVVFCPKTVSVLVQLCLSCVQDLSTCCLQQPLRYNSCSHIYEQKKLKGKMLEGQDLISYHKCFRESIWIPLLYFFMFKLCNKILQGPPCATSGYSVIQHHFYNVQSHKSRFATLHTPF